MTNITYGRSEYFLFHTLVKKCIHVIARVAALFEILMSQKYCALKSSQAALIMARAGCQVACNRYLKDLESAPIHCHWQEDDCEIENLSSSFHSQAHCTRN